MAQQVFDTAELLEAIIIELPLKAKLSHRLVCKQWQAVSNRLKQVKRALFLKPGEPHDTLRNPLAVPPFEWHKERRDWALSHECAEYVVHPLFLGTRRTRLLLLETVDNADDEKVSCCYLAQPPIATAMWRLEIALRTGKPRIIEC